MHLVVTLVWAMLSFSLGSVPIWICQLSLTSMYSFAVCNKYLLIDFQYLCTHEHAQNILSALPPLIQYNVEDIPNEEEERERELCQK